MNTLTLRLEKKAPAFSAKASGGNLCLDIMDVIGADFFGLGVTAQTVKDAIAAASDYKTITVNLNSPGGDLFEGVAIYNTLKLTGKPVNVNVVGLAASAASLIAMCGDTITMQLGTQMMIHRAMAMTAGFADDMRKMADTLDSVTASAADIYVARTGMSKDKVLALMAEETWMNPEQAKADGFASAISEQKGKVTNSFNLSVFKNTPEELKNQAESEPEAPVAEPEPDESWKLDLMLKRLEIEKRK